MQKDTIYIRSSDPELCRIYGSIKFLLETSRRRLEWNSACREINTVLSFVQFASRNISNEVCCTRQVLFSSTSLERQGNDDIAVRRPDPYISAVEILGKPVKLAEVERPSPFPISLAGRSIEVVYSSKTRKKNRGGTRQERREKRNGRRRYESKRSEQVRAEVALSLFEPIDSKVNQSVCSR